MRATFCSPARLRLILFAVVALAEPLAVAQAQAPVTFNLGSNSRGYVSANGIFPGNCGRGMGFETGATKTFAAGDASLSCSGNGWSGQSVMTSSARSIRAMSTVTANNFVGVSPQNSLIGLARAMYSDTWSLDAAGVAPTSVSFTYDLSGFSSSSDLIAASANPIPNQIARFSMGFDAGLPNATVATAPGQYTVSYAITSGMMGRAIPISYELTVFATLLGVNSLIPFSGTVTTDYGNTLKMSRVDFFQQQNDGSQLDVTQQVRLSSWSGSDYQTPLTTVPEPSTFVLLGGGVLALVIARRRALV